MKTQNLKRLKGIVSRFGKARVLVIGDVMLDEFVWGSVSRISPEAPVPVVWVSKETVMPGGASNVANNLATLGAETDLAGVIGSDQKGKILLQELSKRGVNTEGLVVDADRPTTRKTRVIGNHQQVVRIDRERLNAIPEAILDRLGDFIDSRIKEIDAVIIEDYGKGVITPALIKKAVAAARRFKKIITVDPKEEHFGYYRGVTALTPNRAEAQAMVGFKIKDEASLKKAGQAIVKKLNCDIALITLGEGGMCLFEKGKDKAVYPHFRPGGV
jgi:D-beta-D-heptose 7-phosphate kinase/D-beta-D-heptose 1-phosphate adenosyltransferase